MIVNLASGIASGIGSDGLTGIENVWGTFGADLIVGDDADNGLLGFDGRDALSGAAGDDHLVGGEQVDRLDGAAGFDTCIGELTLGCEVEGRCGPNPLYPAFRAKNRSVRH